MIEGLYAPGDEVDLAIDRGLVVPTQWHPSDPKTFDLPQLAQRYQETRAGLVVPLHPGKQPLDFVGTTLTHNELVGTAATLDDIDNTLAKMPLRLVLPVISWLSASVEAAIHEPAKRDRLVGQLFAPPWDARVRGLLKDPKRALAAPETPLRLALRALSKCPDREWDEKDLVPVVLTAGLLLLAMADNEPPFGTHDPWAALDIARMDLFQRWRKRVEWYSVAHDVLFVHLPQLVDHPEHFDVDAAVADATGVTFRELWSMSAIAGLCCVAGEPNRVGALLNAVPAPVANAWRASVETELEPLQRAAASDLAKTSGWSFTAFFDRPLVAFDGVAISVAPTYLAEKATLNGALWMSRNLLPPADGPRLSGAAGRAFEAYAEKLLRDHVVAPNRLMDERALKAAWGEGRVFDLRVDYPNAWLAVEFVRRSPTKETQTSGDYEHFLDDIDKAFIGEVQQIDDCLARGVRVDPKVPARIYPVVVIGGDYPSSPSTRAAALKELKSCSLVIVGQDARCREPAAIDVCELIHLLSVANSSGKMLPDLLEGWLSSNLVGMGVSRWLSHVYPGMGQQSQTWIEDAARWLGLPSH